MGVQLVVRDGTPDWWESPDIWVVPGTDPNGTPGTPVAGNQAYLWARVSNQGDVDAFQVQVDFWVANPSLQIRKSTANHVGTSYADVSAGTSQDVLCLVPWTVTLFNDGHECVVVEASSPSDPLSPAPSDPDVLDAPTYRQIAQRNLSVAFSTGMMMHEIRMECPAGARADRTVEIEATTGGKLTREALESLGLSLKREAKATAVSAHLSEGSLCGVRSPEGPKKMRLQVPSGTRRAVFLNVMTHERLALDEYAVVRVVARDKGRVTGGLSIVVVDAGHGKRVAK